MSFDTSKLDPYRDTLTYMTRGLFIEFKGQSTYDPIFNLTERDRDGTYSMYKLYIAQPDEYSAAMAILGSWKWWCALKKTAWFPPHLEAWNKEIELRDKAVAKATLIREVEDGSVPASKALLDMYKSPAGRPKKEDVKKAAKEAARTNAKVTSLADRMKGK